MRPENVKCGELREEKIENELESIVLSTYNLPQICQFSDDEPPEYPHDGSARASPIPTYDEVIYCDQLIRSFEGLLPVQTQSSCSK
ncbi:unnamed protein product [Caenorhabditis auriculariae]|uniref:Uncharacterized protein n=1 Tax=Caenorhabditis auriculariae TaxID=2777116 RepID=A0A8S1GU17_9PELO|nr:unnamed protein product [Caenorhabditis auriculariae]